MRGLVGIAKLPKGGLGNRLWAYLNLRSIAALTEASDFSKNPVDASRVRGINRRPNMLLMARKVAEIWPKHLEQGQLVAVVKRSLSDGRVVSLRGPMLGEVFAELSLPTAFIRGDILMRRCDSDIRVSGREPFGVVHLRGGDFADWNPRAILSSDYYLEAIDRAEAQAGSLRFRISTDDPGHPALAPVKQHLSSVGLLMPEHHCLHPLECDFSAMVGSTALVSSPSTFCILAGIIGRPFVIHNKAWAADRAGKGELFWQRVLMGELTGYSVGALV